MTALPYGSWPSPILAADLTRSSVRLSPGRMDAGVRYWTEGHPEQGGRVGLWRQGPNEPPTELTPEAYVRTGVNEYGGGDWTVQDGVVAYCSWPDGSVQVRTNDGATTELAPGGRFRYAALSLHREFGLLLAVREDHEVAGNEPETTIVALDLAETNPDGGRVLVAGADFYAHPCLDASGRLAWCEWDHPNLPWDSTRIVVAPLDSPADRTQVAGGPGISALYPAWAPDGALLYLSDASGYWNFERWDGSASRPLFSAPYDFCGPLWVLTPVPYTVIDASRIGCTWLADGVARLGVLAFADPGYAVVPANTVIPAKAGISQRDRWISAEDRPGTLTELGVTAVAADVTGTGVSTLAVLGYADRPAELVELDWITGQTTVVRKASEVDLDQAMISVAQPFSWESPDGPVHAWYYPPTHADVTAPAGELPPIQVWSHGGPTAFSDPGFALAVQYWTTRGIGILDVNYSGSTGYGRAYRDRLRGTWGVADVRDCINGAVALAAAGLADGKRLSIRGGSAGGFTTLAALTTSKVFASGISLYGIGDLETLATDTHKFEKHYLDGLVAPYPAGRQTYLDRSPIRHLDQLSCPMLLLQGSEDKVVPPSQAEAMAQAVLAKGLTADLVVFEGEGHGFRRAENIIKVAELALAFLGRVHGFRPAT